MAQKKAAKGSDHTGEIVAGIGALAAAAAGAGYYFYAAQDAPKHRKKAAKWADSMKKEVIKDAKKVGKLDQKAVAAIVDRAAAAYQGVRNVRADELSQAAAELKKNWKAIQAELAEAGSKTKDAAAKGTNAVKKAAKTATASPRRAVKKAAAPKAPAKKTVKKAVKR